MATGQERRAGRLGERLRGAQRVNVGDDVTFNIDLGGISSGPAQSSSSPRNLPGQAAQVQYSDERQTVQSVRSAQSDAGDPYTLPDLPGRGARNPDGRGATPTTTGGAYRRSLEEIARLARSSSAARTGPDNEPDELDAVPAPSSVISPALARAAGAAPQEVQESPAHAPGSGKMRDIPVTVRGPTSSRSQIRAPTTSTDSIEQDSPSPLVRKIRRSDVSVAAEPGRRPRPAAEERQDEEEPEESVHSRSDEDEQSDEDAVEIDERQAAKTLGQKRPRPSTTANRSPELGSEEPSEDEDVAEEPAPKPKRPKVGISPAMQRQPKRKPKTKQRPKRRRNSDSSGAEDDQAVEITVQRFVNNTGGDDEDDLQAEIPFANRGGETVVDVFAQVCEEVISTTIAKLEQRAHSSDDNDEKKECRMKIRAIRAYREELNSRLLQHAIHLNHWHSLRRRLRHVQKEKLALRDEIIRLKGEREQVALRMDAIRIQHERDRKESESRLNASALMHDIDLAVERGREAPELPRAAQTEANLGNLDLVLAQLSDQIGNGSANGGLLQQVQDFNAFLERAALALESR